MIDLRDVTDKALERYGAVLYLTIGIVVLSTVTFLPAVLSGDMPLLEFLAHTGFALVFFPAVLAIAVIVLALGALLDSRSHERGE